ncbi:MAG: septation protein SepH, partial [Actinomycetota bacterium]|nr:septation protein SepH [Actinomycetota bacterium]
MRQLHVVAVSDDGQHLVLATTAEAATGGFRVAVDDRLRAALRGDLGRPGQRDVRVESALSPRQIQARLRSGESAEEVARAAGVPLKRIERFSGPVLGERAQVLEDARSATLSRARRGPSALPLGASVDLALGGVAGLRAESVTWTAGRREDGRWTVSLSYLARGRTKTVRWLWAPAERAVTALDPGASALGHVDELPAPRRA